MRVGAHSVTGDRATGDRAAESNEACPEAGTRLEHYLRLRTGSCMPPEGGE